MTEMCNFHDNSLYLNTIAMERYFVGETNLLACRHLFLCNPIKSFNLVLALAKEKKALIARERKLELDRISNAK